jgi:hypothetical protein
MAVSLGEAISLQGVNTGAEQLGKMSLQIAEAEKSRTAKAGLAAQQRAQKDQEKFYELFRDRSGMHRLVVPEVNKVLNETVAGIERIKNSGLPYSSNEYMKLFAEIDGKMNALRSYSDGLKAFDKNTTFLDKNRRFYGEGFDNFVDAYRNAKSLEDLQSFTKQNPQLLEGTTFGLTPEGVPVVNPRDAIPYKKDLESIIKVIPKSVVGSDVQSIQGFFGRKEFSKIKVIPYTVKDSESVYTKNSKLFPGGRPYSVEDAVNDYLKTKPDVIEQVSAQKRLGIRPNVDGTYRSEDIETVKNSLMEEFKAYSTPEVKGVIAGPPQQAQQPSDGKITALTPVVGVEQMTLPTVGQKKDNQAITAGGASESMYSYSALDVRDEKDQTLSPSDAIFDDYGNSMTGRATVKLSEIRMLPYKDVGGKVVPARSGDISKVKGVTLFVIYDEPGKRYYRTLDSTSLYSLAGTKFNLNALTQAVNEMKQDVQEIYSKFGTKKYTNWEDFNKDIQSVTKTGQ